MRRLRRSLLPLALLLCASAYGTPPECIDYADLTSPDVVCAHHIVDEDVDMIEVVDSGPQSEKSLHTVHTVIGEHDPNVPSLSTIPLGFPNSVRVGSYEPNGQFASITYTMQVPRERI